MERHWHGSLEHVVYTALGVLIVFHVIRFAAARLALQDGAAGALGKSVGAIVSFPAQ